MYKLLWIVLYLLPVSLAAAQDNDLIIPGERVGFITADSTEESIKKHVSITEYQRVLHHIGEGICVHGSVLYPKTEKELYVMWKSDKTQQECDKPWDGSGIFERPNYIVIMGRPTLWKTKEGITTGTSLETLEKINGKSFSFYGFEWDYGGRLDSWQEGRIPDSLSVDLSYDSAIVNNGNYKGELAGSKVYFSDDPSAAPLAIYVDKIFVQFQNE